MTCGSSSQPMISGSHSHNPCRLLYFVRWVSWKGQKIYYSDPLNVNIFNQNVFLNLRLWLWGVKDVNIFFHILSELFQSRRFVFVPLPWSWHLKCLIGLYLTREFTREYMVYMLMKLLILIHPADLLGGLYCLASTTAFAIAVGNVCKYLRFALWCNHQSPTYIDRWITLFSHTVAEYSCSIWKQFWIKQHPPLVKLMCVTYEQNISPWPLQTADTAAIHDFTSAQVVFEPL